MLFGLIDSKGKQNVTTLRVRLDYARVDKGL